MQLDLRGPFYISFLIWGLILILVTQVREHENPGLKNNNACEYTPIFDSTDDLGESPVLPADHTTHILDTDNLHGGSSSDHETEEQPRSTKIKSEVHTFCMLFSTPAAFYCLAAMFLKRIGFASSVFLAQYVSEKFKWDLHETTWLRVFSSGGAILVYIVTPILNRRLVHRGNLPHLVELNIIRGSLLVLAVSFFGSWSVHRGWFMLAGTSLNPRSIML